ncbi:BppU family phage baseplate upper protein [Limosilactobacillus agrestimuris]|uniref:BppU family phage baseplate upper protein n=1 Tax=Limosilactobacillus agrestimuris TaxID=2941331 RepID=UPI00203C154C|nr:BppU family phage baseplate upper protein [Limosilactobacillus agrestimuris]
MLNQDPKMQRYTPKLVANMYYELDTTTLPNKTAVINAANGRADDDMRAVPIAFVDDGQPHDLTNTTIELRVRDASGVVKVSDKILNLMEPTSGLVIFGIPKAFYEAPGEIQQGYFVLKDKTLTGDDQQISTINVVFTAMQSIDITNQQSTVYISALNRVIGSANNVITADGDNHFTGSNVIDRVTIKNLVNSEVESLKAEMPTVSDVASNAVVSASTNATSISSLSAAVSDAQNAATNAGNSAFSNANSISAMSTSLDTVSTSLSAIKNNLTSLSETVDAIPTLGSTKDYSSDISSVADDVTDAQNAVSSLSKEVYKVSNTYSLASYQIAVNSVMTSSISQAVHDFIIQYDTNSSVYGESGLKFMGSFLQSAQTEYTKNIGNIH